MMTEENTDSDPKVASDLGTAGTGGGGGATGNQAAGTRTRDARATRQAASSRSPESIRGRATGRKVLVVDVGGTHVKVLVTGQTVVRKLESGKELTPARMVAGVRKLAADWEYDFVSIGYPGPVLNNQPALEPWNLGKGWVHFDFKKAFACPVKIINDAAMQALGSYRRGKMLFLGLGTGLGSAMVIDGLAVPMELAHLPYRKHTFEDYVGIRGQEKYGKKKWRGFVEDVTARLVAALEPDEVVLGGGNVHQLKKLPPLCRAGDNDNAFTGGFRLWESDGDARRAVVSSEKHEIIKEHKKRVTRRAGE